VHIFILFKKIRLRLTDPELLNVDLFSVLE